MFIETYYDGTTSGLSGTGERHVPYPEMVGEELTLWRKFLPITSGVGTWFELTAPEPVLAEVKRVKENRLFDRVEIWSRKDPDPMAVGVRSLGGSPARYYSIARWGDANITLDQVKRKLRVEELLGRVILSAAIFLVVAAMLMVAYA